MGNFEFLYLFIIIVWNLGRKERILKCNNILTANLKIPQSFIWKISSIPKPVKMSENWKITQKTSNMSKMGKSTQMLVKKEKLANFEIISIIYNEIERCTEIHSKITQVEGFQYSKQWRVFALFMLTITNTNRMRGTNILAVHPSKSVIQSKNVSLVIRQEQFTIFA